MKLNEKIVFVMVTVLSLFFVLITNVVIKTVNPPEELIKVVKEEKKDEEKKMQAKILRGTIYDREGNKLAYSELTGDENGLNASQKRIYPYGELFSHTVGYYRGDYAGGSKMIENRFNDRLLEINEEDLETVNRIDNNEIVDGASLGLTLDLGMTQRAEELFEQMAKRRGKSLENFIGSAVVMNPTTGEIYCMYSNPSFDPNPEALSKNWNVYQNDKERSPFVSRVTGSKKIPGSVFKILTSLAAVENGEHMLEIEDEGETIIGGTRVVNDGVKAHGNVDMKKAIKVSSNVYFATLSQKIGKEKFLEMAEKFYINKELVLDIPIEDASIKVDMDAGALAAAAYGQGTVQVTPLHMAMVASAVANDGVLMKPYLVDKVTLASGEDSFVAEPEKLSVVTRKSLRSIVDGMVQCVNSGTGTAAAVSGLKIAGKTGTAQVTGDSAHTWFIGFAPADNPQIALCVMGENTGGGGGSVCGPIAKGLFEYCLDNGFIDN